MHLSQPVRAALTLSLAAAAACGTSSVSTSPAPATAPVPGAPAIATPKPLPPVPAVDGPLAVRIAYPAPNQVITSRDSNFIFGSIGSGRAALTINGMPVKVAPNGAFLAYLVNPSGATPRYDIVATRGSDSARLGLPVRFAAPRTVAAIPETPDRKPEALPTSRADTIVALNTRIDSLRTQLARNEPIGVVMVGTAAAADTDRTIVGRPIVAGTYKWFFTPGTIVPLVSRGDGFARVRLDSELDVYVDSAQVSEAPAGTVVPRRALSNMRTRPSRMGVDVIMPIGARAPYFVEEGDRSITITLYGVRGNTDIVNYAAGDSMVRTVEWAQVSNERTRVTVSLRAAPYGYLVLWENNNLILKLRGRPAINAARPLSGLTIAVDAGHPPGGASGPTGLTESGTTLPISIALKRILEERGATVVMTRATPDAVALEDRPIIARKANAHAFVSIHLNAYPDGVNPFVNSGTGTYFFRSHSEPLAREVQRGMVAQLSLPDLGVNYDNLAVVRGTWYPAVLCEGAFLMIPEWEAALRTSEYQARYALGVADGLEAYFRALPSR